VGAKFGSVMSAAKRAEEKWDESRRSDFRREVASDPTSMLVTWLKRYEEFYNVHVAVESYSAAVVDSEFYNIIEEELIKRGYYKST